MGVGVGVGVNVGACACACARSRRKNVDGWACVLWVCVRVCLCACAYHNHQTSLQYAPAAVSEPSRPKVPTLPRESQGNQKRTRQPPDPSIARPCNDFLGLTTGLWALGEVAIGTDNARRRLLDAVQALSAAAVASAGFWRPSLESPRLSPMLPNEPLDLRLRPLGVRSRSAMPVT